MDPEHAAEKKGIIRSEDEDAEWPRDYVKTVVRERNEKLGEEEEVIIRPKVIQFADEAAF